MPTCEALTRDGSRSVSRGNLEYRLPSCVPISHTGRCTLCAKLRKTVCHFVQPSCCRTSIFCRLLYPVIIVMILLEFIDVKTRLMCGQLGISWEPVAWAWLNEATVHSEWNSRVYATGGFVAGVRLMHACQVFLVHPHRFIRPKRTHHCTALQVVTCQPTRNPHQTGKLNWKLVTVTKLLLTSVFIRTVISPGRG